MIPRRPDGQNPFCRRTRHPLPANRLALSPERHPLAAWGRSGRPRGKPYVWCLFWDDGRNGRKPVALGQKKRRHHLAL